MIPKTSKEPSNSGLNDVFYNLLVNRDANLIHNYLPEKISKSK